MRHAPRLFLFALALLGSGCADTVGDGGDGTPAGTGKADSGFATCPAFAQPIDTGDVSSSLADEVSGLAASRQQPDVFWAVNDKGAGPVILAFDRLGHDLGALELDGALNRDWEDLAIGPGPHGGDALYVADTGDNDLSRESARIFRVAEPQADQLDGKRVRTTRFEEVRFFYADRKPRNVETLLVDPVDGAVVLVSRASGRARTEVFVARWPARAGEDGVLERVFDERSAPGLSGEIVAGDVAPNQAVVGLAEHDGDVLLWQRNPSEPLVETLRRNPCRAPGGGKANRTLAFVGMGLSYTMVPEGSHPDVLLAELYQPCPRIDTPDMVAVVSDERATELSGMLASRQQGGVLFTHNDGEDNVLLALDETGEVLDAFWLADSPLVDWEDIAFGPGAGGQGTAIYAADTGDNGLNRDFVQVARFAEPVVGNGASGATRVIDDYELFQLVYDDGEAHDAEALVVDPRNGDLYVLTKRNAKDDRTRVFVAYAPLDPDAQNLLEKVLTDNDAEELTGGIVAADIDPDGTHLALLARGEGPRVWPIRPDAPLWHTLQSRACQGPAADGQVEAVAFGEGGLFMLPEGTEPPLYFVSVE